MVDINKLSDSMTLKVFKCRNVKTPTKSFEAAGWDFFIPENLTIIDFLTSYKMYLDDSIDINTNNPYLIPLVFILESPVTIPYACQVVMTYENDKWNFNIRNYYMNNVIDKSTLVSFNDTENKVIKWLNDKTTIVKQIKVMPHAKLNIPSGIHVSLPNNVFLKVENKSGIASKRGLTFLASVIDSDYQGEIHINLVNTMDLPVNINAGDKIVQLLPMFQPQMKEAEVFDSLENLYKDKSSERGAGGFGSTGEK